MQLYTIAFIAFILVSFAFYYGVGRIARRGQWIVLLVASLVFYWFCGWQNLLFIGLTALSTWLAGRAFGSLEQRSKKERKACEDRAQKKEIKKRYTTRKRLVLAAVLLVNFGVLSYIKYADVLVHAIAPHNGWSAGILLPLGISFYTFQSASYVIDTYNAKYEPEGSFWRYLLFVSFFPQLIQGPINRFDSLASQLYETRSFDFKESRKALLQIGYGLLKKFVLANILIKAVNPILDHVDPGMPGSLIVCGILFYAVYQYADFSGGIDLVLGVARLFGIRMSENFKQPYFSVSLGDFWRRWHITLGAWMRDYVFYPFALLPGIQKWGKWLTGKCGKHLGRTVPACVANILVFFIVGLWHGAESHFILWGLYNGIVIAASDLLSPLWDKLNEALHVNMEGKAHRVFCIVRTFVVVNIGWYFDRIERAGDLLQAFHNTLFNFSSDLLVTAWHMNGVPTQKPAWAFIAVSCVFVFVISVLKERGVDVEERILALPLIVRAVLYTAVMTLVISSFAFAAQGGFMYANF